MTWEAFYLICFVAGLMLSIVALLGGLGHLDFSGHVHVPHIPHDVSGMAHGVGDAAHVVGGEDVAHGPASIPWWNGFSAMIFLCWFGASGYLLTKYGGFVAGVTLALAAVAGVVGGAIVFVFLTKVMLPHERELTAEETSVVGAYGRVSAEIFPGGTGEIVYQQLGARMAAPARAEDGGAIARDAEVFVVRYERGIAYVRKWEEQGLRD